MKPLLNILNSWKRPEKDEEFVDKAVDSLFKKLKTKNGAIEDLEHAINNPYMPSKCVTIARSLDGRLQVSHRKGLPHVIYCRIFRWPDLQSHHELRHIDACEFSFASKKPEVCINPYHYERIELPQSSVMLMPKIEPKSEPSQSSHYNDISDKGPETTQLMFPHQALNSCYQPLTYFENQPNTNVCYTPQSQTSRAEKENNFTSMKASTPNTAMKGNSFYNISIGYSVNHMGTHNSYGSSSGWSPHTPKSDLDQSRSDSDMNQTDFSCRNVVYQEPSNWCSIVYYEFNQRIGEVFNATSNNVSVDGYTSPICNSYGRRFSLGMFSNANRIATAESCRRHIGKGVNIYNDNGDIYLENMSESAVFVQSRNANQENKCELNAVSKVFPGYTLKVFQSKLFAQLLRESVDVGYDTVHELANMCLVNVSFVKGWGSHYYRQQVSACPCWIEVRLNGAFHWLDRVLKEMGSSTNPVTSVS